MPSDDDFAAYLTARWATIVRVLVLLGHDRPAAEAAVRDAMARCRADWERVRRADDVEAHVFAVVLERRPPVGARTLTFTVDEDLARAVDERLQALDAEKREPLVLGAVAGLSDPQVAEVLDLPVESVMGRAVAAGFALDLATLPDATGEPVAAVLRRVAEAIGVSAAPVDAVLADARSRRRRRLRLSVVGAVALVAAAAVAALVVADRTGDEPLPPAPVTRAPNPVDIAWYADGLLHLDQVRVELPPLTDLAELNGGAVYADEDGVVAFVAADGTRRQLGQKSADTPLVASAEEGWAAWVEPGHRSRLVVYDVSEGTEIDSYDAGSTTIRPVAIDQGQVFFDTPSESYAWDPDRGRPEALGQADLLDVEAATRVFQVGPDVDMQQGFFNVAFTRPGIGGLLSPGGSFLLSRPDGGEPGAPYRPLLYDTRTGKRLPPGVDGTEEVLDATFGDNYRVVYLVAPAPGSSSDDLLVLRTCDLDIAECSDVSPVGQSTERPLLAH